MRNILYVTIGLFGATASVALASPTMKHRGPMPHPAHLFELADANNDGQVTNAEAKQAREVLFDRLDRDGNGFLDKPEERFARKEHRAAKKLHRFGRKMDRQQAADANDDGNVSWDEFSFAPSPKFERIDTNADGSISKEEHVAAQREKFAKLDVNQDGFLNPTDRKMRKENRHSKREEMQTRMDTNKDGQISKQEFVSSDGPLMHHFDLDKNGSITRDEMQKARPKPGRPRFERD